MKSFFITFVLIFLPALVFTQGGGDRQAAGLVENPEFGRMLDRLVSGTVPLVGVGEALTLLQESNSLFVDARERDEFAVSRIPGALHVGYKEPDLSLVEGAERSDIVVVYCSVGYRSGKIAERLMAEGFTDVRNLYGGIFEWHNRGFTLEGPDGATEKVHGYSPRWSRWINSPDSVVY